MLNVSEDLTLHVTRGDNVTFRVTATKDDEAHSFKAGDIVRIKVFAKKDCNNVILQKDFSVESDSESATISLTEKDTRIGDTISKPVDYWYEIELNPFENPQTIIAYDEDGPKVFRLYPEGRDLDDIVIEEEDVPFVDKELSMTSTHPVENQAIARKFASLEGNISKVMDDIEDNVNSINQSKETMASHTANHDNPHNVTAYQVGARPNTWTPTAIEVGAAPASHAEDMNNPHGVTAEQIGAQEQHLHFVVNLPVSGWANNSQTVACEGVTANNTLIVASAPENYDAYAKAGVYCSAQAVGSLTFTCKSVPATTLNANVMILT